MIDTALTGSSQIFAPTPVIPLPSAAGLGLCGLFAGATRRRRPNRLT